MGHHQLTGNRLRLRPQPARGKGSHMSGRLKKGDEVSWDTSQGKTEGKVVRKQTSPTKIKGHKVKASAADPQCIVQSDKSGKRAAHRPDELSKR
ncbi:hypothetical protein RPHASCH2410_CH20070 [Rhizobium phaseoli Ch24-10]|nr:hypothetical protein RPHASCH2410_CH20070 [Rhizobium phaseoli Ch24-10]